MILRAVRAVRERSKATGLDRMVMIVLADHANDRGECWPSLETIAADCGGGVAARSVQRSVRRLAEELHEVDVDVHGHPGQWPATAVPGQALQRRAAPQR